MQHSARFGALLVRSDISFEGGEFPARMFDAAEK